MSRFHDAMVRKQQADAEQESGQVPVSKREDRVSILPVPEPTPAVHDAPPKGRDSLAAETRTTMPRTDSRQVEGVPSSQVRETTTPYGSGIDVHAAYERIVQRLLAHRRAKRENVYLVVSAVAGEGASTVARNLARAIGNDQSERVVLVDANLRTPTVHHAFDLPRAGGLTDALTGAVSLTDAVVTDPSSGVAVLTSGSPTDSPPQLLSHSAFHSLVAALRAEFDWVILDGPPVTSYPDAASLASVAGGAILVVRAERTRWEVAEEAKRVLENSDTDILGAVLNRRKYHIPSYIYRKL